MKVASAFVGLAILFAVSGDPHKYRAKQWVKFIQFFIQTSSVTAKSTYDEQFIEYLLVEYFGAYTSQYSSGYDPAPCMYQTLNEHVDPAHSHEVNSALDQAKAALDHLQSSDPWVYIECRNLYYS